MPETVKVPTWLAAVLLGSLLAAGGWLWMGMDARVTALESANAATQGTLSGMARDLTWIKHALGWRGEEGDSLAGRSKQEP